MASTGEGPGFRRRRAPRANVSIPARYASSNLTLDGFVTDLSTDGLFFRADFLDGAGEPASLHLIMPTGDELVLHGEVRWVKDAPVGGGMGIKLIDVSLDDRLLLAALMSGAELVPADTHVGPS